MTDAMTAYDRLIAHVRQTTALDQVSGVLMWDQEVVMPPDGAAQRAEQAAALKTAAHERKTDPLIADWLAALDGAELPAAAARNVALISRAHARATRVPAALAGALAHAASTGWGVWVAARAANRFADFAPTLERMVALKREHAAAMAAPGQGLYDALLDEFEPGMTGAVLMPMLEGLRAPLSELRAAIAASGRQMPTPRGHFPAAAQLALSKTVATAFGYRLSAGRIDLTVHPFCVGSGKDVRITTRVDEDDPLGCLFSVIHEVGHAVYNQNMPEATLLEPAGQYASMGVHESQSRMLENQIGRSAAFSEWLAPHFRESFGDTGLADADALYRALNRVETGCIRTEADEVHYNLHILLRTRLEADLIEGRLEVSDLEEAWNDAFQRDFGVPVPDAARGVLQDTHWSQGLFGYFPTYSLGNIYAAELFAAMRAEIPGIDGLIAEGDFGPLTDWLTEKVHARAATVPPEQIVAQAIGRAPGPEALVSYLQAKFGALYGI
ncbi:carboxypeptidase M32 [Oceanibium sediminis]|uniref:carboxypeptidase M32 n=1 Tax=Oceanibium sediminis TaxID=2026339 RepID=UPI000DD42987|nr:carboxypeptidase M32 [Oceanibium sediminis]